MNHQVFNAAGQCIYCGKSGIELSNEHIVAYALGGDFVLPKASCLDCARVTGAIEQAVLRKLLGTMRSSLLTSRP